MFGGIFVTEYTKCPEHYIFGLDIGTRSIVGTVGYRESEKNFCVVGQVVRIGTKVALQVGRCLYCSGWSCS